MKSRRLARCAVAVCLALAGSAVAGVPLVIHYQGRLVNGTNLVNTSANIDFSLYSQESGGSLLYMEQDLGVAVVDGLYSTQIGDNPLTGTLGAAVTNAQVWLEVEVNGTPMSPRERVVSAAYAILAGGVTNGAIQLDMIADEAVVRGKIRDNAISGEKIADGSISNADLAAACVGTVQIQNGTILPPDLNAAAFSNTFWMVQGNSGTDFTTDFLGTLDNEPLVLAVGGAPVWRLIYFGNSPNLVGGHASNTIAATASGAAIGGGGNATLPNAARDSYDTVAGGIGNLASNLYSSVGGGEQNTASGGGATVPGGSHNLAAGSYSFAAGRRAKASHDGTFVWADGRLADFGSSSSNQFLVRAAGGVGINVTNPAAAVHVAGNVMATSNFVFSTPRRFVKNVPATDLLQANEDNDDPITRVEAGYITFDTGLDPFYAALTRGLDLPDGASITNLTVYFYDSLPIWDLQLSAAVYRRVKNSKEYDVVIAVTNFGSGTESTNVESRSSSVVSNAVIDNSNCMYWVRAILQTSNAIVASHRFYGLDIEYTMDHLSP